MTGNRRDLAAWIMDRAVRKPPAGREDWAKAMRAEFDMLGEARLSWALGCLVAAARWRTSREASYMASLAAGAGFVGAAPLVLFGLAAAGLVSRPQMTLAVMPFLVGAPVLAGFFIALNWPGRRLATAAAVGMGPSLIGCAMLLVEGPGLRPLGPQTPIVLALVGLAYLGGLAGSAIGRRRAERIAG
ncbi:MAG: hypothetical protein QM608_01525 [Caulobacter sp.]